MELPEDRERARDRHWDPAAVPAATVVVIRDRAELEVLLLQRSTAVSFAGGAWVFPGGRIDDVDAIDPAAEDGRRDLETAARRAAVRETLEETGLSIDVNRLTRWSHWTPPERAGRRYTTAFFCVDVTGTAAGTAAGTSDRIRVDGSEIVAHRWMTPAEALDERDAGRLTLTPPTHITLNQLARFADAGAAVADAATRDVEHFATRIAVDGDTWIALYHGDVAYEAARASPPEPEVLNAPGPRHRLLMGSTWTYQRDEQARVLD